MNRLRAAALDALEDPIDAQPSDLRGCLIDAGQREMTQPQEVGVVVADAFSTNVFPVDYIISCDAGQGLLDDTSIPYAWPGRMARSFEAVFRKVQNATYGRLHKWVAAGELRGAVMVYLGQQDDRLPVNPPTLLREIA